MTQQSPDQPAEQFHRDRVSTVAFPGTSMTTGLPG